MIPVPHDKAVSPAIGQVLIIAIVIMLAAILFLLTFVPSFHPIGEKTPSMLQIKRVYHVNEYGYLNYDSRVILVHNGTESFENGDLYAIFYRNGGKVNANIETMNGYDFISTHHYGVQTMGGTGCSGTYWNPHEKIALDFTDCTFMPGDLVRMEIFRRPDDSLTSSHSYTA